MRPLNRLLIALCALVLGGCSHVSETARPGGLQTLAEFYWPYAAIAADVYDQRTASTTVTNQLASPWLRERVQKAGKQASQKYENLWKVQSSSAHHKVDLPAEVSRQEQAETAPRIGAPRTTADCGPKNALVPIDDVSGPEEGEMSTTAAAKPSGFLPGKWQRVPEIRATLAARGWTVFVPDLAVELWRRDLTAAAVEYAIVYRGTVGGGGWLSNFRALTAFTPMIWDQYSQARRVTQSIVRQIRDLHRDSDVLLGTSTEVFITAVGHSLGAGIASYVYYVVPEITKVVGFDPSPVDGASTLPLEDRERIATAEGPLRKRDLEMARRVASDEDGAVRLATAPQVGLHPRRLQSEEPFKDASMFYLYEKGDVLSRLFPCSTGRLWGSSSDPLAVCESVNLLDGNWIQQHSMPRLACALYLITRGEYLASRETK